MLDTDEVAHERQAGALGSRPAAVHFRLQATPLTASVGSTPWQGPPASGRGPGHTPGAHVVDDTWISAVDMVPTFLEAAGITMPLSWDPDGVSALSALRGQEFSRGRPMMWEWRNANCTGNDETIDNWPMLGIRQEEYMLLMNPVSGLLALYDTVAAASQTRNLAADKPELTRALAGQIEDYSRSLPGYATRPRAEGTMIRGR